MPPRAADRPIPSSAKTSCSGSHDERASLVTSEEEMPRTKDPATMRRRRRPSLPLLSHTSILCLLVALDMFSVSLVVPLLHQYYQSAGVHSASQRELLSSLYSSSQIAGGLIIGALSDVGILSRRRILFLSFLGSAVSYALIGSGWGLRYLVFSRVLVGMVKQTMTVSTSLLAAYTTSDTRAVAMGRLSAATTAAWIAGPSVGALLYKHINPSAPALVSSGLFVVNSAVAAVLLPADMEGGTKSGGGRSKETETGSGSKEGGRLASFTSNLQTCFGSSALASVVISSLLFAWTSSTCSYANMASFYEEKYAVEPHYRGYIKSYQQALNFLVQSFFVRGLLSAAGGERRAACIGCFCLAVATLCEVRATFETFLCLVCPAVAVSVGMIGVSVRSLVTQVTPKESIGSVLAALDVLRNAASVTVPFYRTLLFSLTRYYGAKDEHASMAGDPDPEVWLLLSVFHWVALAVVISFLLLPAAKDAAGKGDDANKKDR